MNITLNAYKLTTRQGSVVMSMNLMFDADSYMMHFIAIRFYGRSASVL